MDAKITAVLADLNHQIETENQEMAALRAAQTADQKIGDRMLAVGNEAGQLLNVLVKSMGAKHILELGTSVGYSTIWLAEAARFTGGKITTVDNSQAKHDRARAHLEQAGLAEYVTFATMDCLPAIEAFEMPLDFVLLDVWKDQYMPCLKQLEGKLSARGMIAADNMHYPVSDHTTQYLNTITQMSAYATSVVPVGNGLALSVWMGE